MELDVVRVEVTLETPGLDAAALCRVAGVAPQWWQRALQEGRVAAPAGEGFDAAALRRVRRLAWLQRHFDADPELAALVVDLEEEIE
ncbi:MerR family transcriptional regulator, partial [Tepidimonas alkaliphilus]|uniref:MerR family transcriptional regulator n=1 Tax=Tepidimonas alkaliphilus TaxID=2588942 RepID=UPI00117BFA97